MPELQIDHPSLRIECHLLAHVPGGLQANQQATVGRELGLPEPQLKRDRRLRAVLELGYLNPAPTHELAAAQLHMSRTTYFRQLKTAVERVTDCVSLESEH